MQPDDLLPRLLIACEAACNQLIDGRRLYGLVLRRHQEVLAETAWWWARGIITKRFFACQTRKLLISR
jgi:hypothetical protein